MRDVRGSIKWWYNYSKSGMVSLVQVIESDAPVQIITDKPPVIAVNDLDPFAFFNQSTQTTFFDGDKFYGRINSN